MRKAILSRKERLEQDIAGYHFLSQAVGVHTHTHLHTLTLTHTHTCAYTSWYCATMARLKKGRCVSV